MRARLVAFRRTIVIGAIWTAVLLVAALVSPGTAAGQEAVDPGRGEAYAQGFKLDPVNGGLSFGITYGISLAGHQNTVATGEVRSVDLGVIGVTLAGQGCDGGDPTLPREDQPQPLVVTSSEEGAEAGRSDSELGVDRSASASDQPLAEAVAVVAGAGDPAAAQIGATRTVTRSGVIDGARTATAITEIASIRLAGGQVVLKGLRWEATWTSAPEESATGSFTVGALEIAGEDVPLDTGDGLTALAEVNPLLEPLGLYIDAPRVRTESGIAYVDPLRIGIRPAEERQALLGPVFEAVDPVRSALVDALIGIDCSNATYVTVADLVLGGLTGAGSLNVELGGVTAQSSDIDRTSLLGALGDAPPRLAPVPAPAPDLGGASGATGSGLSSGVGSGATPSTETSTGTVDAEPASNEQTAAPLTEMIAGTRGGPLVWIGLAGLLLLGALAELDRRRMRKAQRAMPMEVA